jgi:hypothetical protein
MSGQVFPAGGPRQSASDAEGKFYRALVSELPDGWRAWHSLRLWSAGYRETEGDFVIAVPGRGLVIVEVKGGRVELAGGRWLQNGRVLDVAPRQQAQGFARALAAAIDARGAKSPPWEIVCAFPDIEFSAGPSGGDVAGLVLGARDLSWLGEALKNLADRALANRYPPSTDAWMHRVHDLWGETWVPRVGLTDRVQDSAQRVLALNEEQYSILDVAGENTRAFVEGGAGTGKTVVACELARRNAALGKRTTYFCFTDALALAVERGFRGGGPHAPRAAAIRRYARDLLLAAGHESSPLTREFWNEVSLRAACDALPAAIDRPDLVVVDESQDFEPGDWMLIEALVGSGRLWVFGDSRQQFWRERTPPAALLDGAARLRLKQQQRNPKDLWDFARAYAEGITPGQPDAAVLRLIVARGDVLDRVRHEVDTLRRGGARPQDIAILSLGGKERSLLQTHDVLGSHRLARADSVHAADQIVADTFLRFKGLERPFVILTELQQGAGMRYETRMHIALTRATVAALVVCDPASVAADPRLVRLASSAG